MLSILRALLDRGIFLVCSWRFKGYTVDNKTGVKEGMLLYRMIYTDKSTVGDIYFDGHFFCKCLEISCRKGDEGGRFAIQQGRYEIQLTYSPKFKRDTAEVMNVPGRTGIRFHPANYHTELDGCIASGYRTEIDSIFDSVKANDALHKEMRKRLALGKLYLLIAGGCAK